MSRTDIDMYLGRNGIPHEWVRHDPAFTAPEIAASTHVKGKDFAKTVIVRVNGKLVMTVMPANEKIATDRLRTMVGVKEVQIADEKEFVSMFPDCEPGAMPPFGKLYGMPVFVSDSLAREHEIECNAGSHTDCVKLRYSDFEKLEHPRVGNFTMPAS